MHETFAYHRLEQELTTRIMSGVLAPGEKLPSLRDASLRAGVSIGTAVAAYAELERKGYVESRPRSGYYVRAVARQPAPPSPQAELPATAATVSRSLLIRQVMEALGRADLLLGLSVPSPDLLPVATLNRLMFQAVRDMGPRAISYAPVEGLPELRRHIALRAMDAGAELAPAEMLVTNGAVEALCIALRCVTRPGDAVVLASPTYYCMLELLETLGLRAIEVVSQPGTGVRPADVADVLSRFNVAAIALIPNFNNPDGSLMPAEAKAEIATMAAARGVPIIEDDIYGELHHGPERPPLLRALAPDPGMVLSCSSFSKTLAPGFRVGWLAPGRFLDKALQLKATSTVCTATPMQLAIAEFLARGGYDKHVKKLRTTLKSQSQAMRAALGREFPAGTRVSEPAGGLQLWVELPTRPRPVDSIEFFLKARMRGIGVCPGSLFSPTDRYRGFVRLCCGTLWDAALEKGLRELGQLAAEMMAEGGR